MEVELANSQHPFRPALALSRRENDSHASSPRVNGLAKTRFPRGKTVRQAIERREFPAGKQFGKQLESETRVPRG